jgi:hypothetical protein
MTKLSRIQKERLVFMVMMTLLVSVILYQMVITATKDVLTIRSGLLTDWQQAQRGGKTQTELLTGLNDDFQQVTARIRECENSIATGDPYRWLMKTLPNFFEADPVDLLNYEPPVIHDWQISPKVPYRAVTFTVSGNAYYQDLGRLLVALENSHPYLRIKRLDIEPKHSAEPGAKEDEKLSFRLEFVSMLKTNTAGDFPPNNLTSRKP